MPNLPMRGDFRTVPEPSVFLPVRTAPVERHPLIVGLFDLLPEPGSVWPERRRRKWLAAAAASFDILYREALVTPHPDDVPYQG